jgi:superfamily I DNA/RNA helicase
VQAEAAKIAAFVRLLRTEGHQLDGIALLYPRHIYGDLVEEELIRQKIPVQRYGKNSIAERYGAELLYPNIIADLRL